MLMDITEGSSVNSLSTVLPKLITIKLKATEVRADMIRHILTLFLTLSFFPAPKFCPAKVVMAMPKALIIIQNILSTFP